MRLQIALGLVCVAAGSAAAGDHVMKVGEVMLSHGGQSNRQFIELEDMNTEGFASTYSLDIFGAAQAPLGSVALTLVAGTHRLTIATTQAAAALGFTANATLTVTLPTDGQACFRRTGGAIIHCLAWGNVTSQVIGISGNDLASTPPDGQSLQRVSGIYGLGTPTPGAANVVIFPDGAIFDGPPLDSAIGIDGPNAPDAPGNGGPPDDDDDGCSVGGHGSWVALVGLAVLALGLGTRRRSQAR